MLYGKRKYKVAHVSYSDNKGGAAIAAYRLNQALKNSNVQSKLFVLDKNFSDSELIPKNLRQKIYYFILRILEIFLRKTIYYKSKTIHSFNIFNTAADKKILSYNPDIIHLHYISSNTISIKEINSFKIPIFWTLHDLWPILPTAHLSYEKLKLKRKNYLQKVIDNYIFREKKKLNISAYIAPSKSVYSKLDKVKKKNKFILPNTLDTNFFKVERKKNDLMELNIGFSVTGLNQYHKGFDLFIDIIKKVIKENNKKFNIHFIGDNKFKKLLDKNFLNYRNISILEYGKTNSFKSVIKFYSSIDLIIITSRSETFCQVATESMSCGVPVIAFKIGGLKDIVINNKNGWLIKPFNTNNFSKLLLKLINNKNLVTKKSQFCRNNTILRYDYSPVSKSIDKIYRKFL